MQMREMLETVTLPGALHPSSDPGYRTAGKTGTAHKIEDGRYVNKYAVDFVGFAPVSNPRVIVAVMIDEPTVGGHFAGQ